MALGELMKKVAEKLNIAVGSLKLFIMSAHIYENEFDKIREIIKSL